VSETRDKAAPHGIETDRHDNRNGLRRSLGSINRSFRCRYDDVNLQTNQFSSKIEKSFWFSLSVPEVDRDVLTFDVALLAQALPERITEVRACRKRLKKEIADPGMFFALSD